MNANDFFNNRNGLPKPPYRFTTLGATIGGPLPLPKVNTRHKLFFFYSFENWDTLTPQPVRRVAVPTELERRGDFSQSRDLNGNLIVIRDPVTRQPFPNNQIPASMINRNGQALLNVLHMGSAEDELPVEQRVCEGGAGQLADFRHHGIRERLAGRNQFHDS